MNKVNNFKNNRVLLNWIRIAVCVLLIALAGLLAAYEGYAKQAGQGDKTPKVTDAKVHVLVFLKTQKGGYFHPTVQSLRRIPKSEALNILEPYLAAKGTDEYNASIRWSVYYLMAGASLKPTKAFLLDHLHSEPCAFVKIRIQLALWKLYEVPLPKGLAEKVKTGSVFYFGE